MSVVAAKYVKSNTIMISSDSYCTLTNQSIKRNDSEKLFLFKFKCTRNKTSSTQDFLWGSVGDFTDKWAFYEFLMQREYVPLLSSRKDLFKLMREFRSWRKENLIEAENTTAFLLVCEGGIFVYFPDGELSEYSDFTALGAGGDVAYALMYAGKTPKEAIEICCETVPHVGKPVDTFEFKIPE